MKMHRNMNIVQKKAWHLAYRILAIFNDSNISFKGPAEVDDPHMDNQRKNMSNGKRKALKDTGRGAVGKAAAMGMKDRETGEVKAEVVPGTNAGTLQPLIRENVDGGATVYTMIAGDMPTFRTGMKRSGPGIRVCQRHGTHERDRVFLIDAKSWCHGTYRHMSEKNLNHYVNEFAGWYNIQNNDAVVQLGKPVDNMEGELLRDEELTE